MHKRVVITGLGVAAPNGVGLQVFTKAIKEGQSGIRHFEELEALKFSCQIAGQPEFEQEFLSRYLNPVQLRGFNSTGLSYGIISGVDAWKDAGLTFNESEPDWNSGIIFGAGMSSAAKFREAVYKVDAGNVRRLGSSTVIQTMASGISAYLGGILGCGNMITTNSSACTTGTEAILMGYERIRSGKATRMLVGSCSDSGPHVWGGFDAMRILPSKYNDNPIAASRPMSASASGFVPGSGGGALVLETLESAQERGATIYAEVLGGAQNSGGQRGSGSITAPNSEAVQRCIKSALQNAVVTPNQIDTINGHLTATTKDATEIDNWSKALNLSGNDFPYINSLKSMVGHCLAASGSIESVASVLQIKEGFIFGNSNCEDLHPEIAQQVSREKIPTTTQEIQPNIVAKASFGFGDVNACVLFGSYKK